MAKMIPDRFIPEIFLLYKLPNGIKIKTGNYEIDGQMIDER